ncbi:Mitochondrial outer membrane protein [Mycena venus]|uniref:Mitochondrial outer membrane protein n=1 Tax=Mycena venus TaxID=2733690 RepID=A0A8H6Y4N5_9AGAR|nr:Mitochondrial outer membrane protein [Mycena venus]
MTSTEEDSTVTTTASTEASVPSKTTSSPVSIPSATTSSESPAPSTAPAATATTAATEAPPATGTAAALASANAGFDFLFANDIARARASFSDPTNASSPFHLLGLGVCAFLEAALGMESGLMGEASEAGAKKAAADAKKANAEKKNGRDGGGRFAPGLEYEILHADAVVLLGLTHALSESYMGYFQCMYALNAAHSKFTKLYKTVFPAGLDAYKTPAPSRTASSSNLKLPSAPSISVSTSDSSSLSVASSRNASSLSVSTLASASPSPSPSAPSTPLSATTPPPAAVPAPAPTKSLFGRWGASTASLLSNKSAKSTSSAKASPTPEDAAQAALKLEKERERAEQERKERERPAEGPVEEMMVAGTAFGFGLFNLVFSLLPKRVQSLVGLLGFKHDRALALRALAVSAGLNTLGENEDGAPTGRDVHGVFAGLVLMTFHGVVLLLSGYQADEARTIRTYKAIVDGIEARYPTGALWILNRAKILRMSNDPQGAIAVLQRGLEAPQTFVQADTLLVFELAWTLLAQRRHQEAADAFVRLTELNSWSHATYYFIAAGCYISLGNRTKAQELLDALPELLQRKKVGGKDLPTEVLIRKKLEFYKEKQRRRGGDPARFVECICISPADELAIFWNTHQRIDDAVAEAHVAELAALTPPVAIAVPSPHLPAIDEKHQVQPEQAPADIDTPDERALRALLLGIMHRTLRLYAPARALLEAAQSAQGVKISTWIPGVALFELAVTDLKEAAAGEKQTDGTVKELDKASWARVLAGAETKLDGAQSFAGKSDIDLSSRLDSRIALLRDEIGAKRAMVGI